MRGGLVLPGGRAILFTIRRSGRDFNSAVIGALRLDTWERLVLVEGATDPHYLSSGHLVFARGSEILAVPFDANTLRVRGTAHPSHRRCAHESSGGIGTVHGVGRRIDRIHTRRRSTGQSRVGVGR